MLPPFEIEVIVLLKITCLSAGQVDMVRVPPKIKSAYEAVSWINNNISGYNQ
jgi:hypothetical protein